MKEEGREGKLFYRNAFILLLLKMECKNLLLKFSSVPSLLFPLLSYFCVKHILRVIIHVIYWFRQVKYNESDYT
jgi:hypothetical protein